jgi:acyl dehydratase
MTIITDYAEQLRPLLGTRGEPAVTEVEKGAMRKFARAIGETNPIYYDEKYAAGTRFGGLIAPPTFVAALKAPWITLPAAPITFHSHLHTDDVITYFSVVRVGDVITTVAEFTDVFVKSGRVGEMLFETFTFHLTNQGGDPVATLAWTEVQYG